MVFEKIVEQIAENTDFDPAELTRETDFQKLGIDSLDMVEMVMNLEDELGVEIDLEGKKLETIGDLVDFIEGNM